jgi:hypothetical protein
VAGISGSPRSCSSSAARAASTRSVWPGRSSVCSMCARIGVARIFGVTRVGPAARRPGGQPAPLRYGQERGRAGRENSGGLSRWPYLDKPDLAMDQPVHARPHVQPIMRDAGCAVIRADPQWQQTGTPQPEPGSPPPRRSGRPAGDRQAAAPRQSSGRLHVKLSRPGREMGRAAAGHGERVGGPGRRLLADAVPARRRKSPKHVTPAHQAGREAAQV